MAANILTLSTLLAVLLSAGAVAQDPFDAPISIPLDYGKLIATMGERNDSLRSSIFDWLAPADSIEQLSDEALLYGSQCGEDRDFAAADFNGDGMDEIAMAWNRSDGGVFVGIAAYDLVNMTPNGWHTPDPAIDPGVLYATETLADIHGEIRVVDGNFYDDEASEFVLAYLAADSTVTIIVYDIATPGLTPEAKASVSDQPIHTVLPQTQKFGTSSRFDVATGDLDNDGTDEIILISSHPDHYPGKDLWVAVYDYDQGTNSIILQLETSLPDANPEPYSSFYSLRRVVAVTGNFDADPLDEVAVMHDWAENTDDEALEVLQMMGCQVLGFNSDITLLSDTTDFPFDIGAKDGLINWNPVTSPNTNVHALTVYNGDLIAGGAFTQLYGGSPLFNYVARWDGSAWRPLGSGADHYVNALTVYNGDLIAAGNFTDMDGIEVHGIARWDGKNWHALGPGMNSPVYALTVYNGDLIAGGAFTQTYGGSISSAGIMRWDGSSWHAMVSGSGMNAPARALTVYNGDLIAGGEFTAIDGLGIHRIARWDGSDWHWLGSVNNTVRALEVYEDSLYAGGYFTAVDGNPAYRIARWNGYQWSMPGEGFVDPVLALTIFDFGSHGEVLVAGGDFNGVADPEVFHQVAWYDGGADRWRPFDTAGSGTGEYISCLAQYEDDLIMGGTFDLLWFPYPTTSIPAHHLGIIRPEGDGVFDTLHARCDFPIDIVAKDIDHEPGSPDELIMLFYTSRTGGPSIPYNALAVAGIDTATGSFYGRGFANMDGYNWGNGGMYGSRHVLDVADFTGDDLAGDGIKPDEAIVLASDFSTVSIKAYELHPDSLAGWSSVAPLTATWTTRISNEMTELIVADLDTATIELGVPSYRVIDSVIQPLVILNVPPVHYDILDGDTIDINKRFPWPPEGSDYDTYCAYGMFQDSSTTVTSEVKKDWGISAGLQTHFSAAGATVKAHLNTEYGEGFSVQGDSTVTIHTESVMENHAKDMILVALTSYDVWEYPVYRRGERLEGADVLVVNPRSVIKQWLEGREVESWIPDHAEDNMLSYRNYANPADNPMVSTENVVIGLGHLMSLGTSGHWVLSKQYITSNGYEESSNFGVEVGASIGYEGGMSFFGFGYNYGFEVNVEGTYDKSELNTYSTTVANADSVHVEYGKIASEYSASYNILPYAYWSKNGALVLDYKASPAPGASFWDNHYTGVDPAFILPWQFEFEKFGITDNAEKEFKTKEIVFIPANPLPGDTVLIIARVHNYGLDPIDDSVSVSFYLGDPDHSGQLLYDKNTGDSIFTAYDVDGVSTQILSQGAAAAQMVWSVPADASITECQRIWALIDPLDEISPEVHDNDDEFTNNKGWKILNVVDAASDCYDPDGDGMIDSAYACCPVDPLGDNCPDVYNPGQEDTDGDGIGDACEGAVCGDANGDLQVNVGDAVFLIAYIFRGGQPPEPVCRGNANGDGDTNVGDAVYVISYVFKGGQPPIEGCCP